MRFIFAPLAALALGQTISLLAPAATRAETITCSYTEPFVNTVYQTGGRTLTLTRAIEKEVHRIRVSARVRDGHIELVNRPQALRQTMVRDGKGSDGMSDNVFPWSSTLAWKRLPYRLHGGCR
jgi:uncharacterized membrane protein